MESTATTKVFEDLAAQDYKYGFVTDVEQDIVPKGLSEDVVRLISGKKDEPAWLLEWRLKAFRAWQKMTEPAWQNVHHAPIDYQEISYYAAPKEKPKLNSLDEVDPEILATFKKLGIPARRAEAALERGRRRGLRLGVGGHHLQGQAEQDGRHLLLVLRSGEGPPRAHQAVPRARSCRTPTTTSPRSTRRCSPTAASCSCPRACAARWSSRPTSASTPRARASSSAP